MSPMTCPSTSLNGADVSIKQHLIVDVPTRQLYLLLLNLSLEIDYRFFFFFFFLRDSLFPVSRVAGRDRGGMLFAAYLCHQDRRLDHRRQLPTSPARSAKLSDNLDHTSEPFADESDDMSEHVIKGC
ncbi:hypothetical protein Ddye_012897 [Dipteronia dyeriana]|uniref:Uncharacterized protein n=1 Tax=Dipteronia dyeriana TaxID=168575 RepID=A0AAD9X553_9ROSI|nr:hypothetical protein Ddye_012897 [Dipteronia dyeriana]